MEKYDRLWERSKRFFEYLIDCALASHVATTKAKVWLSLIAAVPGLGILALLKGFSQLPFLEGMFLWLWWIAFILFWVSFDKYDKLRSLFRERLKIKCDPSLDKCRSVHGLPSSDYNNIVFRALVESQSNSDITNACGRLLAIRGPDKSWASDFAKLSFQPSEWPDSQCKTILPKSSEALDVLFLEFEAERYLGVKPGIKEPWGFFPHIDEIFRQEGEYEIEVEVVAKDTPAVRASLLFLFKGRDSTMTLLEKKPRRL